MKQTIRLTESELKHLIRESVKRVLKEAAVPQYTFHWEINELNTIADGYDDVLQHNIENSGQKVFETGDDAYIDGIKSLKRYNDGMYQLIVYMVDMKRKHSYNYSHAEMINGKLFEN